MNTEQIKKKVTALLASDKSGHADDHTFRVYDTAIKLSDHETADKNIVALAALLHDCDDYKLFGQECADNLTNAKMIMDSENIEKVTQQQVCDIIRNMGYSKLLVGIRPKTIEGRIVSDADMLDAIGALGIIRCLMYTLFKCSGSYFDKNNWPELNLTSEEYKRPNRKSDNFINHFFEKLLKLKKLMLTDAGKEEAKARHDVMVVFLRQFFRESNLLEWEVFLDKFIKENQL